MISLKVEEFSPDLMSELFPLLVDHYEEVAMYKDKIKLNPSFKWYYQQHKAGALHIVVARDEGKVVGYFVTIISTNPHYQDHLFGVNDILYVDPSHRGTTLAVRLFKYAEEKLRERGVSVMTLHMKTAHPFTDFAERLGYDQAEYNYTKYIGD